MKNITYVLLILAIFITSSCSSFLGATGEEAYKAMNDGEKEFVDTVLLTIQPDTSVSELEELFGPIRKQVANKMYDWRISGEDIGSEDTEYGVRVYLSDNEIYKIRFVRLGKFTWETILE